ncbi:MAG: hypothetical protein AB1345_11780 [Chloroflexota bacterium]
MVKNINILAVIPARGGSKGIPKKNIHPLNGKHLLTYVVKSELENGFFWDWQSYPAVTIHVTVGMSIASSEI